MEGWTSASAAFLKYSRGGGGGEDARGQEEQESRRIMSLFDLQCAMLSLFGTEIPIGKLKQDLALIDPDWLATRIGEDTFMALAERYNIKSEEEIVFEAYKEFDKMNRGFISATEFVAVVGQVMPHFSRQTVEGIFLAADLYGVEKVTFPQFKKLIQVQEEGILKSGEQHE